MATLHPFSWSDERSWWRCFQVCLQTHFIFFPFFNFFGGGVADLSPPHCRLDVGIFWVLIQSGNSSTIVVLPHKLMADQQPCTSVILGFSFRSLGLKLQLFCTILLVSSEKLVHYDLTTINYWISIVGLCLCQIIPPKLFSSVLFNGKDKKERT